MFFDAGKDFDNERNLPEVAVEAVEEEVALFVEQADEPAHVLHELCVLFGNEVREEVVHVCADDSALRADLAEVLLEIRRDVQHLSDPLFLNVDPEHYRLALHVLPVDAQPHPALVLPALHLVEVAHQHLLGLLLVQPHSPQEEYQPREQVRRHLFVRSQDALRSRFEVADLRGPGSVQIDHALRGDVVLLADGLQYLCLVAQHRRDLPHQLDQRVLEVEYRDQVEAVRRHLAVCQDGQVVGQPHEAHVFVHLLSDLHSV